MRVWTYAGFNVTNSGQNTITHFSVALTVITPQPIWSECEPLSWLRPHHSGNTLPELYPYENLSSGPYDRLE